MTTNEIDQLLAESGGPCISVIVPTHRTSPDKANDVEALKNAAELAKNLLRNKYPESNQLAETFSEKIDNVLETIDFVHSADGIGIFISRHISKLVKFPFPVIEKVKVGDAFEKRELLYYRNNIIDYIVLSISQKNIKLYQGKGEELHETENEDFPMRYHETYEYSKPTIGTSFGNSSLKGFERDKSVMEEIRLKDLLRKADHLIDKYINGKVPLVVEGGTKEIADYMDVTGNEKRIIAKVKGTYSNNGDFQLGKIAWNAVKSYLKAQNQIQASNIRELFGKEMAAIGMENVWKEAAEGKGLELYLQKDFERPAYISKDGYNLSLRKPSGNNYTFCVDAVDKLIDIVREKRGRVVFTDNGEMEEFDDAALVLRY